MYEKQTLRFGPFQLDTKSEQVRRDGIGVKMQGQPVRILEMLLEHPGEIVTREEIRQRLWASDTFVDFDHSLNTAIKKLRQTLGDDADAPHYIETIPTRGYRFIGEVVCPNAVEAETIPAATDASPRRAGVDALRSRRLRCLVAAIVAGALVSAAILVFRKPRLPHFIRSHMLTATGFGKTRGQSRLITDGTNLYFQEDRPSGIATLQLRLGGGKITELPVIRGDLRDISRDGSELLLSVPQGYSSAYIGGGSVQFDAWSQPLPEGPARLVARDARFPLWSPDNQQMFLVRNGGKDLYRANSDGTKAQRIAAFPDVKMLTLSPDGGRLRFVAGVAGPLWELTIDGSHSHTIITRHPAPILPGTWSADGKLYFFLSRDDDRYDLWVVPEKQHWWEPYGKPFQLTFGPLSLASPTISRDGKKIYAIGMERRGELSVFDSGSGRWARYLGGISASFLDFSKDGKWVAYVAYPEGTLWRSRIDGSEPRQLTAPPMAVLHPRWSPDGKLIAFNDVSSTDMRIRERYSIYAISRDGGSPLLLVSEGEDAVAPDWSPDGTSIIYGVDGRIELRIFHLQKQHSTKLPGSDGYWGPKWSPDGKYVLAHRECRRVSPSCTVL